MRCTDSWRTGYGTRGNWSQCERQSVWVVVAVSAADNKYIKTQNDGEQPNNLLSLPECP